jgi:hypothetical protein
MTSPAPAEDPVARRTAGGPPARKAARKARLRAVTDDNPYGLGDVSAKHLRAELKRRGDVKATSRSGQYVETPKLIAAIVRMARAVAKRVGPGMDIDALAQLAALRDETDQLTGEVCRELTRKSRPGETGRTRYSWTEVSRALGFGNRGTAYDRYADPDGPRKRDGNPDRPRRKQ